MNYDIKLLIIIGLLSYLVANSFTESHQLNTLNTTVEGHMGNIVDYLERLPSHYHCK